MERLLVFSHKTEPKKEICSIREILEKILVFYEHQMALDNIEIVRDLPSHLPQIEIDKNQMMQVFNNLISNARDAMRDGGSLTISIKFPTGNGPETESRFMKISFKDTGCGISRRDLRKIFDLFFTTKEEGKGMGLGLPVCHRIVHAHGGTIRVESRPGKGSAFMVKLPLRQEKDDV